MKVTYYVEVLSSWCHWVEPVWAELKQRYEFLKTQCDDLTNAMGLVFIDDLAQVGARAADARQVRRCLVAFIVDLEHGVARARLRGAGGTEGHRKIFGLHLGQLLARGAQLFGTLRRLRREEFDAETRL